MTDNTQSQATEQASAKAVVKTAEAAAAVEDARMAQLAEQDQKHTQMLINALRSVFGDGDDVSDPEMRVLVRRIPILCTNIESMHKSITKIEDNISWVVKIIIGAFVLGLITIIWK